MGAMGRTAWTTTERRPTRQIHVGSVAVGGGAPVTVQSMTTTKTADAEATLTQIYALAAAGADLVRCTCNEEAAAEGLARIVPRSPVPIIADIHFHHEMALASLEAGVPGLRLHPAHGAGDQAGGGRGQGPWRAHPHRGQRRLPPPRSVQALRRRHAGGPGAVGPDGVGLLRRGGLRRREDLGEGLVGPPDDRVLPAGLRG